MHSQIQFHYTIY